MTKINQTGLENIFQIHNLNISKIQFEEVE